MTTAAIRTIRMLDREPGKATESRLVHGVTVERGVPVPEPRYGVGNVVRALEVGESFVHKTKLHVTNYHRAMPSRQFMCKPIGPKAWRIWRLK